MSWVFRTKVLLHLLSWQHSLMEHEQNDKTLVWMLGLIIPNMTCSNTTFKIAPFLPCSWFPGEF